jgi:hypothetical protein
MSKRAFAEIRLDPEAAARKQRERDGARVDIVADLQLVDLGHDAVVGRRHRRVGEIELRPVELGLGFADRRMAIDIDIRVAVQSNHGTGDLLFD